MNLGEEASKIAKTTLAIGLALICHLLLCAISILGVFYIEQMIHWLWGNEDPKFFDVIPLRYVFGAVDLALVAVFSVFGIWDAIEIFRRNK